MGPTVSVYRSSSDVWNEQMISIFVENFETVNNYLEENAEVKNNVLEILC